MGLDEQDLRSGCVGSPRGRRAAADFMRAMLGLGLSGPLIADMLAAAHARRGAGHASVAPPPSPLPGAGVGGSCACCTGSHRPSSTPTLRSAPRTSRPRASSAEPLSSIAADGTFVPILAAEIPSIENGGRAPDGTWTIWRLKPGVVWHDGRPFTADDVVFTWEFTVDPATGTATSAACMKISATSRKLNDHTIKVVFTEPTPRWYISGGPDSAQAPVRRVHRAERPQCPV